ncbi:hypothetical protein JST97_32845 [bacterium]|nr:hypothetical protein [bacterium]
MNVPAWAQKNQTQFFKKGQVPGEPSLIPAKSGPSVARQVEEQLDRLIAADNGPQDTNPEPGKVHLDRQDGPVDAEFSRTGSDYSYSMRGDYFYNQGLRQNGETRYFAALEEQDKDRRQFYGSIVHPDGTGVVGVSSEKISQLL